MWSQSAIISLFATTIGGTCWPTKIECMFLVHVSSLFATGSFTHPLIPSMAETRHLWLVTKLTSIEGNGVYGKCYASK